MAHPTYGTPNPYANFHFAATWFNPYPQQAPLTPVQANAMTTSSTSPFGTPTPSRPANCTCPRPHASFLPVSAPTATHHHDAQTGQPYTYISNLGNSNRPPVPPPQTIDPHFPAAHFINSTGGTGTELGYDYFFPREHAKVIVLKLAEAPWIKPPGPNVQVPFYACHVPHCVTMGEVMAGFGAVNRKDRSKNQIHRVYPQGGGRWGHMEEVRGDDDRDYLRSTVGEMGWCAKDKGGKVGVVYLWVFKG
ncbi:hypothetical protein QBC44DRAFT_392204 [Cladorrhinum sp. PSN332]|nr:hypothetical protein QBC44DRAFT_392204 [Cladorrhinum sp. PSN332]